MSYLSFNSPSAAPVVSSTGGSRRAAFSRWMLANFGGDYREIVTAQRARPGADRFREVFSASSAATPTSEPMVGIIGGGFAGLFAGLILQSLGIECDLFESSDRVGGRIYTWYSTEYDPAKVDQAGLYGEIGGMRLPQFSADMLPVQQLALAVNAVLARNGLGEQKVFWRKFCYDSPRQRLRFNDMPAPVTKAESELDSFNFGRSAGGDIPDVWITPKTDTSGTTYLPINNVLAKVNEPFLDAINRSFAEGFALMMQYDQYSMWDYLTTVFTLGDLEEFYDPAMGARSDNLPWSVASFLETTNVGTGMYSVSFIEMVIGVYDWGGSKDPYRPADEAIYMLTVDQGMQRFPDACRSVLDLEQGVLEADGQLAQVQVGMLPTTEGGPYSYTAPNLTPDARPPTDAAGSDQATSAGTNDAPPTVKQRVHLQHKAVKVEYDAELYDGHGGINLALEHDAGPATEIVEKQYPYVITSLPNGEYLNGELESNLLHDLSFAKAQAIRELDYMAAFKAFMTFKRQFWAEHGSRQGVGAASTDRPNRQIIYPSYGYEAESGVLQVYCWDQDARRLGALPDEERINECLKGIAYLYPEVDVLGEFAGYDDGNTTKTWFWDHESGGGAFALFAPGQYRNMYATLLTPEFDGCLNFAGECCSVHHGWIVGALDSAYNAVYHVLQHAGATDKVAEMQAIWGSYAPPDVSGDAKTANVMDYAFTYNEVDRAAASIAPGATASIYGSSDYIFTGDVPAFIADYDTAPETMKKTARDRDVLAMLNRLWDDNVTQRAERRAEHAGGAPASSGPQTAVELLESIYYGDNFQTIPAPPYWLKDDDEFARQQLAGFMPTLLTKVSPDEVTALMERAAPPNLSAVGPLDGVRYVADYRQFLQACTVTPVDYYLAKPIVLFTVTADDELMPVAIQLEEAGELFTPNMPNAANAWILAKMQTNCAGQTLHDVGFHQLLTHQICAMVSIALFSEEVFAPTDGQGPAFQEHPVFKLLRPHVVKTVEFQQTIYDATYDPYYEPFPATREPNGQVGVYNLGFVYDLIFSCGRIGNYQLQDRMFNDDGAFRFLDQSIVRDAARRGVDETAFSYAYVHDTTLWFEAIADFVASFVDAVYPGGDADVASDPQLQRFFGKLIPAFNHRAGSAEPARRFPSEVTTTERLAEVLTGFIWQFSVQHTVVNDGAYNHAAFVPNASTLMLPLPATPSSAWTPADVLACMPSQTATYGSLGDMTFTDVQLNASVTGQGPYPETVFGRGVLEPSIDVLQDSYAFVEPALRTTVDAFYQSVRRVGDAIRRRMDRDSARYLALHPHSEVPPTVKFDLVLPTNVMNTIQA